MSETDPTPRKGEKREREKKVSFNISPLQAGNKETNNQSIYLYFIVQLHFQIL
jgi:hypothetical protein